MRVDIGDADAGVAVATKVIDDFMQELVRIGKLPTEYSFDRSVLPGDPLLDVLGEILDPPPVVNFKVKLNPPPTFEFVNPPDGDPYTRVPLRGVVEVRPVATPTAPPLATFPLDAKALLALVLKPSDPVPVVGLEYQGTDGPPALPVSSSDIDAVFEGEDIKAVLDSTTMDLAGPLVKGLNESRFPDEDERPPDSSWSVVLTLMPSLQGTMDCFAVTVGPPGTLSRPSVTDSFVKARTGMGLVYSRHFLDLMLDRGARAKEGTTVEEAKVRKLRMRMTDTAIHVEGHVVRPVTILPDVDIRFKGPLAPSLVRGTTAIAFDSSRLVVKVDEDDEIFYEAFKWVVTIGTGLLLLSGVGTLTVIGILSWVTLVQEAWQADVDIEEAPNVLRDSLASALGAELSVLADSLDDDSEVPPLAIDATPDSLRVVDGNILLFAQILVVPITAKLQLAEFAAGLRRFGIYELSGGRRFRAQELARLMAIGKITVPGFHQVDRRFVRANPDNAAANNLLEMWESNLTREPVVR